MSPYHMPKQKICGNPVSLAVPWACMSYAYYLTVKVLTRLSRHQ